MIVCGLLLLICSISPSLSRMIPRARASGPSRVRVSQRAPLEMNTDIEDGGTYYNSPLRRNPSYMYPSDDDDDGRSDQEPIKPRKDKKVYVEWLGPDTFVFKGDPHINPKSKQWHPEAIKSLSYNDYKILKSIDPELLVEQLKKNMNRLNLKPLKKHKTYRLDSLEKERQEKLNYAVDVKEIRIDPELLIKHLNKMNRGDLKPRTQQKTYRLDSLEVQRQEKLNNVADLHEINIHPELLIEQLINKNLKRGNRKPLKQQKTYRLDSLEVERQEKLNNVADPDPELLIEQLNKNQNRGLKPLKKQKTYRLDSLEVERQEKLNTVADLEEIQIDPELLIEQLNKNQNRGNLKPLKKQKTYRLDSLEVKRQEKLNNAVDLQESKIDREFLIEQLIKNQNRGNLKPLKKQNTYRLDSLEVKRQEKLNKAAELQEILAKLRAEAKIPKSSKVAKSNWREPRTKTQISPMTPYDSRGMLQITKPKDVTDRNLNNLIKKVVSFKVAEKQHSLRQPLTQVFNREEIKQIKQIADAIDEEDQRLDNDYAEQPREGNRAELERLEDLVRENSLSIARSVAELGPNKVDNRAGDSNVQEQVFSFDQLVA